ncbi:MAG: prephenate dehydrogenase/arogenate dehydrogenase family protein [Candidatus Thorarchaeota archaeon]|jgi:prephenate dehydrogenase
MKVAVIGAAGQMGRWLLNHFEAQGYTLVASDSRDDELRDLAETSDVILASSNVAAVKDADAVVVSVPIDLTTAVIHEIAPHMKQNAILCEISSVKGEIPRALQKAAEYGIRPLCIHPMFGPGARALRKKLTLIPIVDFKAEDQLIETLFPGCQIIVTDSEEHDRIIALTISLPYFVNTILASVLADEDISLLERLGGTTFTVQMMLTGSIMSQPSALHASLHSENKHVIALLQKLQQKSKETLASLVDKDSAAFERLFSSAKKSLETGVNLAEKYDEMYRLLELMDAENGEVNQ